MENIQKVKRSSKVKNTIYKVLIYTFLVICAVAVLFPFYWMVITSIKDRAVFNAEEVPQFFVVKPTFINYVTAFTSVNLGRQFFNTALFAVITTLLMVVVSILAAYAFSRLDFKGKNLVFCICKT